MAGFDPNQPRDKEGKWTAAVSSARKAAKLSSISPAAMNATNLFAEKNYPTVQTGNEQLQLINKSTGEIMWDQEGEKERVDLYEMISQIGSQAKNQIITHTHPGLSTHSEDDLSLAAVLNLEEIIVVTVDGQHIISPGEQGWDIVKNFSKSELRGILSDSRSEASDIVYGRGGFAEEMVVHATELFSNKLKLKYTYQKRRS